MIMQFDVMHIDADECLYHGEQHELMLYLSISLMKLITNNVLVSMGCRFLNFLLNFGVYLPFLQRPITAMGNIFQWVVRFQPRRCSPFFLLFLLLGRCWKIVFNLKCWQLSPKIYPRDFIDFWFNCVRLLNHVKVTLSKPFTHGMKSVVSKLIGPLSLPLLCRCPPFAVRLLQGSNSVWLERTAKFPHIMAGCKKKTKNPTTISKVEDWFTKHWMLYCSWIDNIWSQGPLVLPAATSPVLVHVDKLTSTLTVHVEVTFLPTFSMASMDLYHSWAVQTRGSW